ncbi:LysR substrate-binding domain-containing protein [Marilutibacter chinensis]|uniref:LysR substrate-binding domain-containing protein n=1 Tax=Marilutibacter chinensis TaxID=2912247 RepID=A0ABS9HQ19_9GAMM|nr:LysR substrate-binding domain-containing protein [Lysobacter chinensis]MCF7220324.1 LysR substrate-binding domain-containing protein [Lysobacter chinensis]
MDFDPTLLRAFVAVHDSGGFTRAAERLHLTQSAISHQIRRLEEQAGRPLLRRTTRRLALTEDGEEFLSLAQRILDASDALTRRFHLSPVSGVIRFGVSQTFLGARLPTLLGQFARSHPCVRLEVNVASSLDFRAMVAADELDMAVVLVEPDQEDGLLLRSSRFVWSAAESYAPPTGDSLPLAFAPAPCLRRHIGLTALERAGRSWHFTFTSSSNEGLRAATLAGLGVAVMTTSELVPGLKIVDDELGLPPLPKAEYVLVRRPGERSAAAEEFVRLLQDHA